MSTVLAPPETEAPRDTGGGDHFRDPGPPGGGGGDGWGGGAFPLRYDPYRAAVWVFLIPVLVFFAALTRAMLVSHQASANWVAVQLPPLLYVNTAVLLGSSLALEIGRRGMRTAARSLTCWLWITTSLGFLFLAGQMCVWKKLAGNSAPQTSTGTAFFYLMTLSHGAHLLGALGALAYLTIRQTRREMTARRRSALNATAIFWHFMGALWLYILVLLACCM